MRSLRGLPSLLPAIPFAFGLVACLLRYVRNGPLWLDEQMIARNIRDRGFADLAGALDFNQSAPLAWLWAERALVSLFGTSELVLRALPLAASIGTLALAWWLGRRWLGTVGAFALVALFATNESLLRYATEVKQYSGDLFWTTLLLLLAMAVTAGEPRYLRWWLVAAVACLFSMGAMLATPVFATVIVVTAWLRGRWREAWRATWPFVIWFGAFAVHYALSLRHVLASDYMANFWGRRGYPPASAGPRAIAEWCYDRLVVLANDPLGLDAYGVGREWFTLVGRTFWVLVLVGLVVAAVRRPAWAALLGGVVAFGFALAVAELVPLYMRLAMWIIPSLFVAVAFTVDAAAAAVAWAVRPPAAGAGPAPDGVPQPPPVRARRVTLPARLRLPARAGAGAAGALTVLAIAAAVAPLTVVPFQRPAPPRVDYRAGVGWLASAYQPGDLTIAVFGSQHAIGWYGEGRLEPHRAVIADQAPGRACTPGGLGAALAGHRRVLLFGDLRDPYQRSTAAQLEADLAPMAAHVESASFGWGSLAKIIELKPGEPSRASTACYAFS